MSKGTIATVAAIAAAALAGCGGSNSNSNSNSNSGSSSSSNSSGPSLGAFKSGFQSQKASFSKIGTDLQQAIASAPSSSNTAIASEFASLAKRATAAATALRGLKPPSKYSAAVSSLVTGFDSVAADLSAVATAATSNNGPAAKSASTKLVTDSATVHAADLALTRQLGLPVTG